MNISLQNIQVNLPGSEKPLFRLSRFEILAGAKVLIQGESGKGKTTLLHLIAGLFLPMVGEILIGQHHLGQMSDEQRGHFRRRHVGMIFQKLNLLEHLTATENVMLVGASREQALIALTSVGLKGHGEERSAVLSLGEQQRVAVARVLSFSPDIILADEPTSSLDTVNSEKVIDLLFKASGSKTLVVVSHDHRIEHKFSQVVQFADLVAR